MVFCSKSRSMLDKFCKAPFTVWSRTLSYGLIKQHSSHPRSIAFKEVVFVAGHSKWANIKRRKAAQDQKRGKAFSKLSKAITVAAKSGGDPTQNLKLKYAIDKAKAGNMPNNTIENAIKKGTGELGDIVFEELMYEGFAPGGVAILVEALSDKRTRTTPEVKKIFENRGGNLGAQGSVSFMFDHQGLIAVTAEGVDEEEIFEVVTEAGAEDLEREDDVYTVTTGPKDLHTVSTAIADKGWTIENAELMWVPQNTIAPQDDGHREKVESLVELLEDHDDVQNVYSNLEDAD